MHVLPPIVAGSTDKSVIVRIVDSTDGTPETTVVWNTAGIDLRYRREGEADTTISEATLAALTTAHTDGGFLHIGNGYYRIDLPDAAVAAGSTGVLVHGTVTGMVMIGAYVPLSPTPVDVRQWLGTAAATPTTAGVPEVDVTHWLGTAAATPTVAGVPEVDVTHFNGTAGTFAAGIPQVSLTTSAINGVADQVWDEAASGHVASGSFGQAHNIIRAGTAQAGAATTITLDASASAVDDFYNNQRITITAGTGVGQGRIVEDYVGATKVATVASWATNPDATSVFVIQPFGSIPGASAPTAGEVADAVWDELRADHVVAGSFGMLGAVNLRTATAQAGTSTTITLDASASATNDLYNYNQITITAGTGAGQSRQIIDYVGSSKVATVGVAWTTNPSSDSVFVVAPLGVDAATVAAIADAVWDELRSGHAAAGSFGEYVLADTVRISGDATSADNLESYTDGTTQQPVNVTHISGDSTAADNLESLLDGTGGVTLVASAFTLTTPITANATQLSGDSTAADNAEAFFDGTGYAGTNNVIPTVTTVTTASTVSALGAQAKADVNAEVVDALATDTYAEPGQGAPAATASLSTKINYLYKNWRNKKTQTATEFSLFNDDASTVGQKSTVSDAAGTTTKGEMGTGA